MKKHLLLLVILSFANALISQNSYLTPFELKENTTATYKEAIDFYKSLGEKFTQLQVNEFGMTDSGHPLHEVILSMDEDFDPTSNKAKEKIVIMVNNAIHPGEPCGVDASMMLVRDYLTNDSKQANLKNIILVFIPIYNIGGALNRNSTTRANQNGPIAYGFRGNAKNLDLNRDFIKCDTKNAQSFNKLFNKWNPDILIDNHTSNGADYQYTMTLIATAHSKMDPTLASYMNEKLLPQLYKKMEQKKWPMTPYVYSREKPDDGIAGFLDLPRYSSGYAALFNCISFMPETHMLKPFEDRVQSTYTFMESMIQTMDKDRYTLKTARRKAVTNTRNKISFDINWTRDSEKHDKINFLGFEAKYKPSKISGKDRLYYDHDAPFSKEIPYFNYYKTTTSVDRPMAYIIPQGYHKIIDRLKWNGVKMKRLSEDLVTKVQQYRIKDFETSKYAYEGHYLHSNTVIDTIEQEWNYFKGDYVVFTNQPANRYIIETLEPQAPDSYFAWNFFDGILMQKEHFSAYVFEDLAAEYLENDPTLKEKLEAKKSSDSKFADSANAQLNFIYKNSKHYERTHRIYPVARFIYDGNLPLEK